MHVAQQISHLPGVPLSVESQHELYASEAVGTTASSWSSRAGPRSYGSFSRGNILTAQLILLGVCLGHAVKRRNKLCTGGRMSSTAWCRWATQPLWHPNRTDSHSTCNPVLHFRMRVFLQTASARGHGAGVLPHCHRVRFSPALRCRFSANSTIFM